MHHPLAYYDGYCAACDAERPLVLIETGPRGLRGWLAGAGVEDRTLNYTCQLCGRVEHVPATEAEDLVYDATLPTWPDTFMEEPVALPLVVLPAVAALEEAIAVLVAAPAPVAAEEVPLELALAVEAPAVVVPEPRRPVVRVITLPGAYVRATDLVLAAA